MQEELFKDEIKETIDEKLRQAQPLNDPYILFEHIIKLRCHAYFDETDMDPAFVDEFGAAFAGMIDKALKKFADGQLKHGGDLRTRDLEYEELQEIIDLFCYRAAKQTLRASVSIYV